MSIKFNLLKNYLKAKSINIKTKIADDEIFQDIGSLNFSKKDYLTFYYNDKYFNFLSTTKAKGCFIKEEFSHLLPKSCLPIVVNDPFLTYAFVTNFLFPNKTSDGKISNNSNINFDTSLGNNIQIDNYVTIKENTKIGNNCIISNNVVLGPNVELGSNTIIMSNCIIFESIIGNNSVIQPGVIIGGKGFGFTPKSKVEIIHSGNVIVGDNVDIGSNTTIDRATLDSTVIGDNVRIDNLVQIAHNVRIGENSIIASQTGIAGSTIIGKNCLIGGQVGISGHLKIGNNVTIAGKSGVTKNIDSNSVVAGFPAMDIKIWKRNIINQHKNLK